MAKFEHLDVGIIVERRDVDHPWLDVEWVPVGAVPGAPVLEPWTELERSEGIVRYHAATFTLVLHRRETEAYLHNLQTECPAVYVILREAESADEDETGDLPPMVVSLVTLSPYEAQDYMDSGEEAVSAVPMADQVRTWVASFVDRHHVEEEFVKRRRQRTDVEKHAFGQEPVIELRRRMRPEKGNGSDGR